MLRGRNNKVSLWNRWALDGALCILIELHGMRIYDKANENHMDDWILNCDKVSSPLRTERVLSNSNTS